MSSYLNKSQLKAVQKLGRIMCPGITELNLPSFKEVEIAASLDIVLAEIPEADLKDLKLLLTVLSYLPAPLIYLFLSTLEALKNVSGPVGTLTRLILFGLRGIVFSVYYSSKQAHEALSFSVAVAKD